MIKFFDPVSKVQKDRKIMRVTDNRMAKYSRRGLIFNFLAYLACLSGGKYVQENWDMTLILTAGLLLITLIRGFFLFRFDHLYPRAPAKWRTHYFIATLSGAFWWGVILFNISLELKMQHEAPLLWLYTVVFFSTTAHAFAPFQRFLAYYQFLGLMPAAIAAILIANYTGYLYGTLLLVFFLVLSHQCRLMSESYWEGLEASYALSRKTRSLEEEKRDTRASVKLSTEFLRYLQSDLLKIVENKSGSSDSINDAIFAMFDHVNDFNHLISKELQLDKRVFNVRHELQYLVAEFIDEVEGRGIYVETSLSPTLPMRLKGDATRFAQIVKNMLELVFRDMEAGVVMVDVEFLREYEKAGEIFINMSRTSDSQRKRFFIRDQLQNAKPNMAFVVSKGLAELMDGNLEIVDLANQGSQIRFCAKMELTNVSSRLDFHRNSFEGHSVLLVHHNPRIVDVKRRELESLGFNVTTETQFRRAVQVLLNSYRSEKPIESVLYSFEVGQEEPLEFHLQLKEHTELRYVNQLIATSRFQQTQLEGLGFNISERVYLVDKPTGLFELEFAFHEMYGIDTEGDAQIVGIEHGPGRELDLIMFSQHDSTEGRVRQKLAELNFKMTGVSDKKQLLDAIAVGMPEVILLDCEGNDDLTDIMSLIRTFEIDQAVDDFVPILGFGSTSVLPDGVSVYEVGLDDYIETSSEQRKLSSVVKYWATLH